MVLELPTTKESPMPRLLDEQLFSLKSRTNLGHPYSTLRFWFSVGLKTQDGHRIKLATIKKGGIRMTSREALERFYEAISQ